MKLVCFNDYSHANAYALISITKAQLRSVVDNKMGFFLINFSIKSYTWGAH